MLARNRKLSVLVSDPELIFCSFKAHVERTNLYTLMGEKQSAEMLFLQVDPRVLEE